MATGIGAIIGGTILACKETLKVEEILAHSNEQVDKIETVWNDVLGGSSRITEDDYSEKDYQKDLLVVKVQTAVKLGQNYLPAASLMVAGVVCVLSAYRILHKRNVALAAAYKLIEQGWADYRRRVIAEHGEEADYRYAHGIYDDPVTEKSEDGTTTKVYTSDPNEKSVYARWFDETCANFNRSPEVNLMFVKCQQNYANELLRSRGHVFLNEVYDSLGLPHTKAGSVVGWVLSKDGDNYIDFGLYNKDEDARAFLNGTSKYILIDPNVDGVIYDKI